MTGLAASRRPAFRSSDSTKLALVGTYSGYLTALDGLDGGPTTAVVVLAVGDERFELGLTFTAPATWTAEILSPEGRTTAFSCRG